MQCFVGSILVALVLTLGTLDASKEMPPTKPDVDGKWEVTSINKNGKESLKSKYIVTREKGRQAIVKDGELLVENQYAVKMTVTPKEIVISREGIVTSLGIYEIKGDTMTISIYNDDETNDTEFPKDFKPSEHTQIITYKRVKESK